MEIFFENPLEELHLREIARRTKLSPNTVMNINKVLVKQGLLLKAKKRHIVAFKANIDNINFINEKKLFNLRNIYDSNIVEYLADLYNNPSAIILFGSYSKGEDNAKGDIDIAVLTKRKEKANLDIFERKLKRSVHLLEVDIDNISKEFLNSLINGIVLHGYLSLK